MNAESRARNIKLLLFDVDGVLTNGEIIVHPNADGTATEVKAFTAHDGIGFSLARLGGIRTGIITRRESPSVTIRSRALKIEFVYQNQTNKLKALEDILAQTGFDLTQVAYVGDDIVDLPVMRLCGLAIAAANARPEIKAIAHYVTPNPGGQGAGRDAVDFILSAQGSLAAVVERYLEESTPKAASA